MNGLHGDGFFDGDADIEQAELEAAGRSAWKRIEKAHALIAAGDKAAAARVCPHSWAQGIPGEPALRRCLHCGSAFSQEDEPYGPLTVVRACEVPPDDGCTCKTCKKGKADAKSA